VVGRWLYEHNAVRGGISDQRRIRSRHSEIVRRRRPDNALDNLPTQRANHRVTIRNQVVQILRRSGEARWRVHKKK
jgi:hypothetical protein